MRTICRRITLGLSLLVGLWTWSAEAAQLLHIATYNVDNYLLKKVPYRPVKSAESRAKVRESLRAIQADVVALQEMGGTNGLLELRRALKREGLDYPYWELVTGWDTNIQVAVLSKFPIVARRPHTNDTYLLHGRRFQVSRGFVEVDIEVNPKYRFTLLTGHLKSKRRVPEADQAEMREQEAVILREIIDTRLEANPEANLVVLGDFNDTKDTRPIRTLIGRGRFKLVDTRPAERNGDNAPPLKPGYDPRNITWTHFYGADDTYSRIDYILLSPGMAREWLKEETYVLTLPNWGVASDHRPIVAGFVAEDR